MMYRPYKEMIIDVIADIERNIKEGNKESTDYSLHLLKKILRWESEQGFYDSLRVLSTIRGNDYDTKILEIKVKKQD